jgi:hypothetical protein
MSIDAIVQLLHNLRNQTPVSQYHLHTTLLLLLLLLLFLLLVVLVAPR